MDTEEKQRKTENLFRAHGLFIIEIRSVFHTICLREFGKNWQHNYSATFRQDGRIEQWNWSIRDGIRPESLIECANLGMFADYYKDYRFFKSEFPNGISFRLATYFADIAKARNMITHYRNYDRDIADIAYLNMIAISDTLEKENLVIELRRLKNGPNIVEKINAKSEFRVKSNSRNNSGRLYSNTEIQIKITDKAKTLSDVELNKLCDRDYSKDTFNNIYSIFVKVPQNASIEERQMAIKDHNNKNRWTVKYEFNRNNYSYFITTQWYPRNDTFVKDWLQI